MGEERGVSMAQSKHIMVVNDAPEFLELMTDFLEEEGYHVTTFPKHQGAFERIKDGNPDLLICDLVLDNEVSGFALLDMLYLDPVTRAIPTILCTAAIDKVREISPSLAAKGIRWLEKPFEIEKLLEMIEETFKK
jgi:CheY-like chemotaxis protein